MSQSCQTHFRNVVFAVKFLKYVLPFWDIIHYEHGSSSPPPPPPPPILGGDLKSSDQNNWEGGGAEQKIKFGGGTKFKEGDLKF